MGLLMNAIQMATGAAMKCRRCRAFRSGDGCANSAAAGASRTARPRAPTPACRQGHGEQMPSNGIVVRPLRSLRIQEEPLVIPKDEQRHETKDCEQRVFGQCPWIVARPCHFDGPRVCQRRRGGQPSSYVLRDIVPGFAENANCPLHVVVSHEHVVSVVRRDREDADTGGCQRCRQPRQYTGDVQVQRASNRQHRPRALRFDARRNTPTSHTIDSSAGVRVTEKNAPCTAQGGSESPGVRRHIAYEPGTRSSVSLGPWSVTSVSLRVNDSSESPSRQGITSGVSQTAIVSYILRPKR